MSVIPADIVDKYYEMNPSTDDLIPHAALLREGMVVLLENTTVRSDVSIDRTAKLSEEERDRARKLNRWGRVSHIHLEGDQIHFVAEYADGTKRKRTHPKSAAWLVKIDSMRSYEPDIWDISQEIHLSPNVVFTLLNRGWGYVTDPYGNDPNRRSWEKIIDPPKNTEN